MAWEAVRWAKRPRVHTFLATSPIHMQHKLRMSPDQARALCLPTWPSATSGGLLMMPVSLGEKCKV